MWVLDSEDDKIYAYSISTKARDSAKEFNTLSSAANNPEPYGTWSDGATMWVADITDDKLYAYSMSTKARVPARDFTLTPESSIPRGIWSDGYTMWVIEFDSKIYAYDMGTKARVPARDFNNVRGEFNNYFYDLYSDGTTLWVADCLLTSSSTPTRSGDQGPRSR